MSSFPLNLLSMYTSVQLLLSSYGEALRHSVQSAWHVIHKDCHSNSSQIQDNYMYITYANFDVWNHIIWPANCAATCKAREKVTLGRSQCLLLEGMSIKAGQELKLIAKEPSAVAVSIQFQTFMITTSWVGNPSPTESIFVSPNFHYWQKLACNA